MKEEGKKSFFPQEIEPRLFEVNGKLHLLNTSKTRCRCGLKVEAGSIPLKDINWSCHVCPTCWIYITHASVTMGIPSATGDLISSLEKAELAIIEKDEEIKKLKELK
jgi:hypothetical protein